MDVEKKEEQPLRSTPATDDPSRKLKRRRRIIIWSSVIGTILTIALIMLILSLTVFKAKKPKMTVDSVSISDLDVNVNPIPLQISLNLSLAITLTVNNPNKVGAKYQNSSAILRYRGKDVGDVPIPAGKIGSDDSKQLNLTLTVFADRLASDSQLYSDILSGNMVFSTYAKIKLKVRVLFIHIHATSTSTCDVNIDIKNRRIANQTCHYKNRL
ncbi:uncharacterized protein [Rutidosis leptorrhynchoides]|uniref:uncharacterized protein n=1 Tax=Rutidosis leptorrhynchoides TaxID=125765 RepID=UPI003A99E533